MHQSTPLVYVITDRRKISRPTNDEQKTYLIEFIERALAAGVDMIQIRERDLSTRELLTLTEKAVHLAAAAQGRILISDRADIALCVGAGVHLTTRSIDAGIIRSTFGKELLLGVSTHSLAEARAAESGGADFVVFGPIFETESKRGYGPPVGLESLHTVAIQVSIPVLALGGINANNYIETLEVGAAGIAGISIFSESTDLERLVQTVKRRGSPDALDTVSNPGPGVQI